MRRTALALLAALLGLIGLAACGDDDPYTEAGPGDEPGADVEIALEGRTFTAEAIEGHDLVPGTAITIAFTADAITFDAGCNHFSGTYSANGADLSVRDVMGTQKACEGELGTQEEWITTFLGDGPITMDLADDPEGISLTAQDGDSLVLVATGEPAVDPDPDADEPDPATDPLAEREFHVADVTGHELAGSLTLTFDAGQVTVEGGCNRLSAPYSLDGTTLEVEPLGGTEMGCDPPLMEQDAWIAAFLAESPTVELTAGEASALTAGDVTLHLTRPAPEPAADLVGPMWALDTLFSGSEPADTAASVPMGVEATIAFAADGTYEVAAGCNTGRGTYAEAGAGIYQVDPPGLTRRRCDEEAMGVEASVLTVLDGEVTVSIEGDRLTVWGPDGPGLGFVTE